MKLIMYAVAIAASALAAALVSAAATSLGPVTAAQIGGATGSTQCDGITLTPEYGWRSSTTYEVTTLTVSDVPTQCRGLKYALVFTQGDSTGQTAATRRNGTLDDAASTEIDLTNGQRPKINDVNNTTSSLKIVLLVGEN